MKVLKKICSLFIIIVIFSLALSNISFALTSAASEYLDKESIVKIANYHISTYLKEDSQTKGMAIKASNDFVELYDINGNLYAYIVPIMEDGRGEIGYFTIGADKEDGSTYMIFIGENAVDKLNAKRKIIDKSNAKIVFIPPMKYIIMIKDVKGNNRYFDIPAITDLQNGITLNDTENDITIAIENNIDKLKDYYETVIHEDVSHLRTKMLKLLFEESKLQDVVALVGEDVLPDEQRLILEIARVIKVGFLQQNAFHKEDTYVPLKKQVEMLKTIDLLYERGLKAIKKKIPISKVRNGELYDKVMKMKYTVPNDRLDEIEELNEHINEFYDELESYYSS